jgi:hypothetical protein
MDKRPARLDWMALVSSDAGQAGCCGGKWGAVIRDRALAASPDYRDRARSASGRGAYNHIGGQKARCAPAFMPEVQSASRRSRLSPLQSNEALRTNDSNEPSSCCLKSWLAVEGNSSPRKTKGVKAPRPTFQETGPTGSSPERTALDVLNQREVRAIFGCCTRLRPARAEESIGEGRSPSLQRGEASRSRVPHRGEIRTHPRRQKSPAVHR